MSTRELDKALPDDLAAVLGAAVKHETPPDAVRARVQQRIHEHVVDEAEKLQVIRRGEGEWEQLMDKVEVKRLNVDPDTGAVTSLWRLAPGAVVGEHEHEMDEECLVLRGELHIADQILVPGDFLFGARGTRHDEVSAPHGALLLIRAEDYRPAA